MMARKHILDTIDSVTKEASLQAKKEKKTSPDKPKMKAKLIHIDEDWEKAIKAYQGGTVTSYIRIAIREKMKRDGIL